MKRKARDPDDRVSPELRRYIVLRDGECVVARFVVGAGPCRDRFGRLMLPGALDLLTVAHVRDRGRGGRMAKRPSSTPRRLVAACYGHHIADPVVDRAEVRDVLDAYLERIEGPDQAEGRPWETISRVRSAVDRDAMLAPGDDLGTRSGSSPTPSDGG